jgi:hypothetical protein
LTAAASVIHSWAVLIAADKENAFSDRVIERRSIPMVAFAGRHNMSTESKGYLSRWIWRGILLSFILLPLLPEILIFAASAYAGAVGCQVDATMACALGPPSASQVIRTALQAAYFIGSKFADDNIVLAWLASCYVLIMLGWARLSSRLLLALGASLIFAVLPYFGPIMAIGPLVNPKCRPNEGGIPPGCTIFGGDVGEPAHDAVRLGWKFFYGAPVAFAAFVIFVIVVLGTGFVSRRRLASRTQGVPPA